MKIAKWDDGFILETDSRREDPLYYYMRRDAWKDAIGFEVDPMYQELEAKEVRISVFPDHRDRENRLSPADREQMYCRVVSALLARFTNWLLVELRSTHRSELSGDPPLRLAFEAAGFLPTKSTRSDEFRWRRA
jgi:hypothetical protein